MRKLFTRHENLRRTIEDLKNFDELEPGNVSFERFENELRHSRLIVAADINDENFTLQTWDDGEVYGVLFTDMDEFRKSFSDEESESHSFDFWMYKTMVDLGLVEGFLLNPESESLVLGKVLFDNMEDLPKHKYDNENSFKAAELKELKDKIDNQRLERFISDPSNIGKYDELFDCVGDSTMLTLMVSDDDLKEYAVDGVINTMETGPLGSLYIDRIGGKYATAYTSEDKIGLINTESNKHSQIVNFSMMTDFVLNDDMDGIIINPGYDDVLITRNVLLEYWPMLKDTCNDSRLNSAIFHMFLMES